MSDGLSTALAAAYRAAVSTARTPAISLWGAVVSWPEMVAFVLAIQMVVLNMRVNAWAWPLAIVSSLLYFVLFRNSKLYGDASLQMLFAVVALWGWWQWLRGTQADGGWFLKTFTDTDVPRCDAFPTAASGIGQWLLGRKCLENWRAWIVVNVVSVALFAYKGRWLTTLRYRLFIAMSFVGWRAWQRLLPPAAT